MDRQTLLSKLKDLSIKKDNSHILEISKFIDNSTIWFLDAKVGIRDSSIKFLGYTVSQTDESTDKTIVVSLKYSRTSNFFRLFTDYENDQIFKDAKKVAMEIKGPLTANIEYIDSHSIYKKSILY